MEWKRSRKSEFDLLADVYDIDLCAPGLAEGPLDRRLQAYRAADKVLSRLLD